MMIGMYSQTAPHRKPRGSVPSPGRLAYFRFPAHTVLDFPFWIPPSSGERAVLLRTLRRNVSGRQYRPLRLICGRFCPGSRQIRTKIHYWLSLQIMTLARRIVVGAMPGKISQTVFTNYL